jgi:cyclophilin family peptidyl-prolyl cis-trans isomerase
MRVLSCVIGLLVPVAFGPAFAGDEKEAPKDAEGKKGSGNKALDDLQKKIQPEGKANPAGPAEIAVMETNLGTIKLKFFPDAAPKAVENFKGLAKKGYYNGVTFHRVIDGFMLQGGDPTASGRGGESLWGKPFEDEFSPKYRFDRKGLLAMANAGPRTNGSQFFITLGPTPHLNDRHTIFGEVISGMDVVEKIGKVKKGRNDKPLEPVVMKKVTIEPAPKPDDTKGDKTAPKPEPKAGEKAAEKK